MGAGIYLMKHVCAVSQKNSESTCMHGGIAYNTWSKWIRWNGVGGREDSAMLFPIRSVLRGNPSLLQ
jgi:hypothetical protein